MAIYECRQGFAFGRGNEVKTQRGMERVFGAGRLYSVSFKDVKEQVALGWLVPADDVESTSAVPGQPRNVQLEAKEIAKAKAEAHKNQRKAREEAGAREPVVAPDEPSFASKREEAATTKKPAAKKGK